MDLLHPNIHPSHNNNFSQELFRQKPDRSRRKRETFLETTFINDREKHNHQIFNDLQIKFIFCSVESGSG